MGRPTKKPYNGEPPYKWRVFFDSGKKRISRKFRTKKDANNFLRGKEVEYINLGRKVALTLDEILKQQAYEAAEILQPYGRTLTEAAEFLKKHLEATERSAKVSDLVLPFLEAKKNEGKSARYISDLTSRLRKFTDAHSSLYAAEVSARAVQEFLDALNTSGLTKNHYRRVLSAFFTWCERLGYCSENPAGKTVKVKVKPSATEIFTPQEMQRLLTVAASSEFGLGVLANLILCGFAGLRQSEFERLAWEQVKLDRGKIDLSAGDAKTAKRRLIDIQPVLEEWLKEFFPFASGSVKGTNYKRFMQAFRASEKTPNWKENGLRHSFASYLLERTQNPGYVSLQLGHNDAGIVFQHYRELVTTEDTTAFWGMTPDKIKSGNIIAFKEAVNHG